MDNQYGVSKLNRYSQNDCINCKKLTLEIYNLKEKIIKLESILNTTEYPDYLDLEISNLSKRVYLLKDLANFKLKLG